MSKRLSALRKLWAAVEAVVFEAKKDRRRRFHFTIRLPIEQLEARCLLSTVSFAPKVDYDTRLFPTSVTSADFNGDGKVDLLDLKLMGTDWRKQQSGLTSDLDGNGKVDFSDFGILGDNWSP